jgi:hypothetical protein
MKINAKMTLVLACDAALMAGAASLLVSPLASATAQFAKETGKSCGDCHTNPQGGGALTPFGEAFKANGNKLPK